MRPSSFLLDFLLNSTSVHPFFVSAAAVKASASRPSVFTNAKPTQVRVKAKAVSAPKSKVQAPRSASYTIFPVTSSPVTPAAPNTLPEAPTRDKPDSTEVGELDTEGRKAPLPKYSYRDYHHPTPTVVYTRHEEEADDLVLGLKPGCVLRLLVQSLENINTSLPDLFLLT